MLRGVFLRMGLAALACGLALTPVPGRAADLGGDCCADLEERVANLEATTTRKGNRKVSLDISGRVNANILWWSENASPLNPAANGPLDRHSGLYFGNAATFNDDPEITFSGSGKISADLSAGFSMRIDDKFAGADTQTTRQTGNSLSGDATYVFLKSKSLGELRLGNQYSASDDAYYVNFGGGTVGGLSGLNHTGTFLLRDANGKLSDTPYASLLGEMSDYRDNRLMYVSPTLSGFTLKADVGGAHTASASLTWIGKVNTVEAEAGIGYQAAHGGDGDCAGKGAQCTQGRDALSLANPWTTATQNNLRSLGLSGSVWDTASGFYLSGEFSHVYAGATGRQDPTNWFAQAGWAKNASGIGLTTLYGSYDRTDNKAANDTSAHYWNIGIDQAIDAAASNVYLHYQRDQLDTDGVVGGSTGVAIPGQSVDSVTGGMVVRF